MITKKYLELLEKQRAIHPKAVHKMRNGITG